MWSSPSRLILVLATSLALAACAGYRFAADAPVALPKGVQTLAIKRVDIPTMDYWLEPRLRSLVRDEFTRRGALRWVDKGQADALLVIRVIRYTTSAYLWDANEQSVKRTVALLLAADIVNAQDNTQLWTSGDISVTESYYGDDELPAAEEAAQMAVRVLADRLGNGF